MAIGLDGFPIDDANERAKDLLIAHLGIEVIEAGDDYLKARMPIDQRTKQPTGVLNGGASVALVEMLA
jgi:1,4-dihydroxy-2-naphthoyl-CoA hydrolase